MWYCVLTQTDNFMFLAPEAITLKTTGVSKIVVQVADAVDWLSENNDNKLIITMPLDVAHRKIYEKDLSEYNDRCIALDPALLFHGSEKVFKNTQDLQIWILDQIRKIIKKD